MLQSSQVKQAISIHRCLPATDGPACVHERSNHVLAPMHVNSAFWTSLWAIIFRAAVWRHRLSAPASASTVHDDISSLVHHNKADTAVQRQSRSPSPTFRAGSRMGTVGCMSWQSCCETLLLTSCLQCCTPVPTSARCLHCLRYTVHVPFTGEAMLLYSMQHAQTLGL